MTPTQPDALAAPNDEWIVLGPDGSRFTGPTPFKAAILANRHRIKVDPVAAKQFLDTIEGIRKENEAENERLEREHGTLNCPACGGSGHIGDVTDIALQQAASDRVSAGIEQRLASPAPARAAQPQEQAGATPQEPVYLVATGEESDRGGMLFELYEGAPPPMCDAARIYFAAEATPPARDRDSLDESAAPPVESAQLQEQPKRNMEIDRHEDDTDNWW